MNNLVAVTIGDINGVGIKILIDLWKRKKISNFILLTNLHLFNRYLNKNKIKLKIIKYDINNNLYLNKNNFYIYDFKARNNNENTYFALKHSYYLCSKEYCKGIINLPLNKYKIKKEFGKNFLGQTEYYQKIEKKKYSNMIFHSKELNILTLTTHIPISKINNYLLKKDYIYNKIILYNKTLIEDFNIKKPKIAIAGLNPHAGENGTIGNEEEKYIIPIIKKLIDNKINIKGPFSPDTLFSTDNLKIYNNFVCFYHDQALIPFKLIKGFNGINYTGSLEIIRISPDHGTGYGLSQKKIDSKSLYECFKKIKIFIKNRYKID